MGGPGGASGKEPAYQCRMSDMQFQSLGWEDPLATHSSILAWRIPWTEEPGRLRSIGSQNWTRLKQLSMHAQCGKICPGPFVVLSLCGILSAAPVTVEDNMLLLMLLLKTHHVWGPVLSTFSGTSPLSLGTIHFADEKTEAQRD